LKDLSALPTLKEFQELEAGEEVMEEVPVESVDRPSEEETASEAPEAAAVAAGTMTPDATEENVSG
jgi:hypothetical protein